MGTARALLREAADICTGDSDVNVTALIRSTYDHEIQILSLLIQSGANVDSTSSTG